jgi:DNA-directed RNA polymerase specialized sigma24 family protein
MHLTLDLCGPATRDLITPRPATERVDHSAVSDEAVSRAYSVAYRLTGSEADAEAATTEALLRMGRRFDQDRLYEFTVRAVLDFRRAQPTDRGVQAADAQAPGEDRLARLEAAIAALPPTYRDPFVLADVERLAVDAVGELLGVAVPAVRSRLHHARMLLRAALRDSGGRPA